MWGCTEDILCVLADPPVLLASLRYELWLIAALDTLTQGMWQNQFGLHNERGTRMLDRKHGHATSRGYGWVLLTFGASSHTRDWDRSKEEGLDTSADVYSLTTPPTTVAGLGVLYPLHFRQHCWLNLPPCTKFSGDSLNTEALVFLDWRKQFQMVAGVSK